jgi:integrase
LHGLPVLKIDAVVKREGRPRVWFEAGELEKLLKVTLEHITELAGTRWINDAAECYDFVVWMVNTGMRVGEAMNVRFCDVEAIQEVDQKGVTEYCCLVKNIKGKRGTGECRSGYNAIDAFDRIVERRNIFDPAQSAEKLFLALHRDMFNTVLEKAGLKMTNTDPPPRRDFVSLRHTYIASRLVQGVGVYDLAKNCRTSVTMIENHYSRFLSPRLLKNLNRVGEG